MSDNVKFLEADPLSDPAPVSGAGPCGSSVSLTDVRGEVQICWFVGFPTKLDAWVALYKGSQPPDPNGKGKAWGGKGINGQAGCYNTGKPFGPGWSAALFGRPWHGGPMVYIAKTPVT